VGEVGLWLRPAEDVAIRVLDVPILVFVVLAVLVVAHGDREV
jgi:hypothetical protein